MRFGRTPASDGDDDGADTPPTVPEAKIGEPSGYDTPLGTILVRAGVVVQDSLNVALRQQEGTNQRLGALLIASGALSERDLAAALAAQANLPLADLSRTSLDPEAGTFLEEEVARRHQVIGLGTSDDGTLVVAITQPRPAVLEEIRLRARRPVMFYVASQAEIRRAIDSSYRALTGVDDQVAAFSATVDVRTSGVQRSDMATMMQDTAPVVRVVNMVITQALRDRASDVHLEPQDAKLRVRFRVDGALHDVLSLPADMAPAIASRVKVMAGMNIVERRRPQDGQIATTVDGREIDIRVATTGTVWGEKVVLRILDKSRSLYRLQDLGMPQRTYETFARMIRSPYGMVICAGPTGSGKTTTLYASLTEINGEDRNVTTIEDPVEYVFPSINQIQINEIAGLTFATGLKAILRQDPDMILVGEMRDVETARIAVQSALTGHFVLSSLHATDAVSALYRFLDMGIEAFLVASSVIGVVGQRLVRRMCNYCRVPYEPDATEMAFYTDAGGRPKEQFWIGEGCNFCAGTGYSDRVGVYELLRVTEEMRELLVSPHPSHDEMRKLAMAQGLRSLQQEGARLVADDMTTIAEILRCIYTL